MYVLHSGLQSIVDVSSGSVKIVKDVTSNGAWLDTYGLTCTRYGEEISLTDGLTLDAARHALLAIFFAMSDKQPTFNLAQYLAEQYIKEKREGERKEKS